MLLEGGHPFSKPSTLQPCLVSLDEKKKSSAIRPQAIAPDLEHMQPAGPETRVYRMLQIIPLADGVVPLVSILLSVMLGGTTVATLITVTTKSGPAVITATGTVSVTVFSPWGPQPEHNCAIVATGMAAIAAPGVTREPDAVSRQEMAELSV